VSYEIPTSAGSGDPAPEAAMTMKIVSGHAPQLQALRNVILPLIVQTRDALGFKCLRFWSAGG